MKISIIGAGGVGGYFGGRIAQAGYDVTFVARGENLQAIREHGLTVKSINGDFSIKPVRVTDKISEAGDSDLVILGIKAWQVLPVAQELKPFIRKGTTILPLQNGVMAYEELASTLGKDHVVGGLCRIISKIESPGVIAHLGIDPVILFGEMDNSKSERVLRILDILEKSGIKSWIPADIQSELWKKFISICVSGLLAVTRSTYGEIRELKETRSLMMDVFNEVYELSQKMGITIEPEFVSKILAFVDTFAYDATSSLTRDVWEGKPSELEYQNGTVVRLGEACGVNTPVNRFIYNCILPMEIRARKISAG